MHTFIEWDKDQIFYKIVEWVWYEINLKNKKKRDRLLYKATALDQSTNLSAEQSIIGGSLSSTNKGSDNAGYKQANVNHLLYCIGV